MKLVVAVALLGWMVGGGGGEEEEEKEEEEKEEEEEKKEEPPLPPLLLLSLRALSLSLSLARSDFFPSHSERASRVDCE